MEKIAAVLVASDTRSTGQNVDRSGPAAVRALEELGIGVAETIIVPDEEEPLASAIATLCDRDDILLVITSGGTGLGPRDVTPEATRRVIEKDAPGIAELIRLRSLEVTPHAALSRGIAGVRNRTLIINMPGSPKAVAESIAFIAAVLPHALQVVSGRAVECAALRASPAGSNARE